ncbi:hypothetical protein H4R24_003103 [Coemansia sp. RSA 988]|nr:hypothetical protein H4R24_003103 [Coemansia sp. RSA 988]
MSIKHLKMRIKVTPILSDFYKNTSYKIGCSATEAQTRQEYWRSGYLIIAARIQAAAPLQVLYIPYKSTSSRLAYKPIKGIGMRCMLQKHGLRVLFNGEFRISSICPECNVTEMKNSKTVKNTYLLKKTMMKRRDEYLNKSKPSKQTTDLSASEPPADPSSSKQATNSSSSKKKLAIIKTVICHGLLCSTNEKCFEPKVCRDPAIASATDLYPDPHPNL